MRNWQLGLEMRMPVGYRRAYAGVRNAEIGLERARYVLIEQERRIALELSNAVAEVHRSPVAMSLAEQRYNAAIEYRTQARERIRLGRAQFDVLLEAQRRVLESQIQFINAEVENALAVRNVHFERGSLLNYHGVSLAEGESEPGAYVSANRRRAKRNRPMNYVQRNPIIAKAIQNETLPNPGLGGAVAAGVVPDYGTVADTETESDLSNVVVTESGQDEQSTKLRGVSNSAGQEQPSQNRAEVVEQITDMSQPESIASRQPAAPVPTQTFSDEIPSSSATAPSQRTMPGQLVPNRPTTSRTDQSGLSSIITTGSNSSGRPMAKPVNRSGQIRAKFRSDLPIRPVENLAISSARLPTRLLPAINRYRQC